MRHLAFYLPQFHPIELNDRAWGPGFTEWHNVTQAVPRFKSHYQPHLPGELGFYDLRLRDTREAQATLARQHGIDAFVHYHYWFSGQRLLDEPLRRDLEDNGSDLPFALCWANESWSRRWDGSDSEILQLQQYSDEDDERHIAHLLGVFGHPRYLTVRGRPVLLLYRASLLPDVRRTTDSWRAAAERWGFPGLYLIRVEAYGERAQDPAVLGFDAACEFQPDRAMLGARVVPPAGVRAARRLARMPAATQSNAVFQYDELVRRVNDQPATSYKRFPCVTPAWDNSARRRTGATVLIGSEPEKYQAWLETRLQSFAPFGEDEDFLFVNAWNEWAEGAHLEPDRKYGRAYLEAHLAARLRTGL